MMVSSRLSLDHGAIAAEPEKEEDPLTIDLRNALDRIIQSWVIGDDEDGEAS
jgi:hypothetical protein